MNPVYCILCRTELSDGEECGCENSWDENSWEDAYDFQEEYDIYRRKDYNKPLDEFLRCRIVKLCKKGPDEQKELFAPFFDWARGRGRLPFSSSHLLYPILQEWWDQAHVEQQCRYISREEILDYFSLSEEEVALRAYRSKIRPSYETNEGVLNLYCAKKIESYVLFSNAQIPKPNWEKILLRFQ